MSVDGWDESRDDGDAATPQVPSQGGRPDVPPPGDAPDDRAPRAEGNVPAQRDRREDSTTPPHMPPPSDTDLIGRMRAGDDSAYEELYRRPDGPGHPGRSDPATASRTGSSRRGGCPQR